jgi:hypothetical protein
MATDQGPRVVAAERIRSGVLISFSNGDTRLYSESLLYSVFGEAEALIELEEDEAEPES